MQPMLRESVSWVTLLNFFDVSFENYLAETFENYLAAPRLVVRGVRQTLDERSPAKCPLTLGTIRPNRTA